MLTAASDGGVVLSEDEVDDVVEQWQRLRLEQVQNSWKGNKKCLAIDCHGYLRASLQQVRQASSGGSVGVQCSHCHATYCWSCQVSAPSCLPHHHFVFRCRGYCLHVFTSN